MKAFEIRLERSGSRTKNFEIREGKRCALTSGVRQFFRRKIAKRWRAEREATECTRRESKAIVESEANYGVLETT